MACNIPSKTFALGPGDDGDPIWVTSLDEQRPRGSKLSRRDVNGHKALFDKLIEGRVSRNVTLTYSSGKTIRKDQVIYIHMYIQVYNMENTI